MLVGSPQQFTRISCGVRRKRAFLGSSLSRSASENRTFGGVENAQKPRVRAFQHANGKKTPQKHSFLRFFPLQAIPLSRIIGLTKEEIEHFRTVLFFSNRPG